MMENSRYSLLDDKRFKEEMDECYFHPLRKFASDEIKFIARNANAATVRYGWNQRTRYSFFKIAYSLSNAL